MKILIAEDDRTSALLLERILTRRGHRVVVTRDGLEALNATKQEPFDAILTDWMMPNMDGIELIRRVRDTVDRPPIIIVVTTIDSDASRIHALEAGADDYLTKPYVPSNVLNLLTNCVARRQQPEPPSGAVVTITSSARRAPFIGVCIAASTGGPQAVGELVHNLNGRLQAAFFLVQHGPAWMFGPFVQSLQRKTEIHVNLAEDGLRVQPGQIYVAPGERHLVIESGSPILRLSDEPPINFVRPAADPLFQSVAKAFGRFCIGVVMTGMGRDGSVGASHIASTGGIILVQAPETAVVPSMPNTVIRLGIATEIVPLPKIAETIGLYVNTLSKELNVQ